MEQKKIKNDGYTPVSVTQLTRVDKTKGLVKYYRVRIETTRGIVLDVDIDEDDFTPEKAKPILTERAKNADSIMS